MLRLREGCASHASCADDITNQPINRVNSIEPNQTPATGQAQSSSALVRNLYWICPALLALLVFAPTLRFDYVWDDWYLVGRFVQPGTNASWGGRLLEALPFSSNYFRPAVILTFILETWANSGTAVSHGINLALHALNTVLLAKLAYRYWPGAPASAQRLVTSGLAAGVFALHPAMVESVAWVSCRFDLMACSFVLLALIAAESKRSDMSRAVSIGSCYLLALLCKEMAITLPIVLLLLQWARVPHSTSIRVWLDRRERIALAGMLIALALYIALRIAVLGHFLKADEQQAFVPVGSTVQRWLLSGYTLLEYLQIILLPFFSAGTLHAVTLPVAMDSLNAWLGLMLLALAPCVLLWHALRANVLGHRIAIAVATATLVSLLAVLHLTASPILISNSAAADRAALLPIAYLALGLPPLLVWANQRAVWRLCAAIFLSVWLLMSVLAIHFSLPNWRNDLSLWTFNSNVAPNWTPARLNLANIYLLHEPETALWLSTESLRAAQQPWQRASALSLMARAKDALDDGEAARQLMEQAIDTAPTKPFKLNYLYSLAHMLAKQKQFEAAAAAIARATAIEPAVTAASVIAMFDLTLARGDLAEAQRLLEILRPTIAPATLQVLEKKLHKASNEHSSDAR